MMIARKNRLILGIITVVALSFLAWVNRDWLIAKIYLYELESEDRVNNLQVDRLIQALDLKPGDKVADVGAGTGLFSRPLARAVGEEGIVYAVDINPELLSHIEETAQTEGISNIQTVLAAENNPLIPEPVNLIFLCDTLHHMESRAEYLKALRQYLQPSARIAVIDFGEDSPHLLASMKYSLADLKRWMESSGYDLVGEHSFLEDNFFVVYRCRDCNGSTGE
ncbi:methyltransferase domain-containing protein [Acidobacteria bacterium AH-259-A15]|nr:methyltransferase domain-containing protein [Acidobacteria bacterium AH-259-A15]